MMLINLIIGIILFAQNQVTSRENLSQDYDILYLKDEIYQKSVNFNKYLPKFHTELIQQDSQSYEIKMGGKIDGSMTRDPIGYWAYDQYWEPNLFVKLENIGNTVVINPWLRRTDEPDTRSIRSIVDYIIEPGMSEAEKASALYEFEIRNRFHATTSDNEVKDVIKRFNCYGYTLCGDENKIMSDLWKAAGLKVRDGHPNGHSTAEVFYDNQWHLLDSDESIICLLRDNRTIASEEQIVMDHDLMKRTHTYGPLHNEDRIRDEMGAALHYYEGVRDREVKSYTSHTMDFILRPAESIIWAWNTGNRYHSREYPGGNDANWNKWWRLIAHVMNGWLTYSPDIMNPITDQFIQIEGCVRRNKGVHGKGLYLMKDSAKVVVPVESAYPIVGGRLIVDFARYDLRSENVLVSISFDRGNTWKKLYVSNSSDYCRMYIDLNEFFQKNDPARYHYLLKLSLSSNAVQPNLCFKGFELTSELQMARLAMPGLKLGKNQFLYTDESINERQIRITHSWEECSEVSIPDKPIGPVYPPDGGISNGTFFQFNWNSLNRNPDIIDYEFQLSEYPDIRWSLSPNFDRRLISRTNNRNLNSFQIPYPGLLNPEQTYFWRIRARNEDKVWGPWSDIFSFTVEGPGIPQNPQLKTNLATRKAKLYWKSNNKGTVPKYYKIYGSDERGFSVSDTTYIYNSGREGKKTRKLNLLYETEGSETSWTIPNELWQPYYRIVAVDSQGRESGPSTQIESKHPLIKTQSLPVAQRDKFYETHIEVVSSIGHLVSATLKGKPYQLSFRNGDSLYFSIENLPSGLQMNESSGLISGTPTTSGTYNINVYVYGRNEKLADKKVFKLKIIN